MFAKMMLVRPLKLKTGWKICTDKINPYVNIEIKFQRKFLL